MQNPIIQQIVETLRGANNVLITVKNSPSVDELTASIALTLILNHMNKHATTVFSGQVPSTIEFLQPEMAIETTTDSLRDFIIALDKSKADKLRYKVENDVVRIFITPYRSSISEEDLEFSQGDFNVDVVVALGVLNKEDFDHAVLEHGRILHDATVIAINNQPVPNEVGAISWQDQQASSVSEMIASIADLFGQNILDSQIATALMTGIVAETDRFKNQKTTPQVLSISSTLMSAGANQQLIAEELDRPPVVASNVQPLQFGTNGSANGVNDGTLSVPHDEPAPMQEIDIDEHGNINTLAQPQQDLPPLQDIQHDLGLEATSHTENEDLTQENQNGQGQPEDQQEPPQPDSDDQSHSLIEDRSFLAPPMNANSENESAQEEPSGLFGSFMHKVKSSAHRSDSEGSSQDGLPKKPKRIEPLESYSDGLDFQDDIPLFKAEDDEQPPVATAQVPEQPTDDKQSPFTEAENQQAELPAVPAPYMPPVTQSQPAAAPSASDPGSSGASAVIDDQGEQTLEDIERAVHSPHIESANGMNAVGSPFVGGAQPDGLAEFAADLPPVVGTVPPPVSDTHDSPPAVPPYTPPAPAADPPASDTSPPIVPPPLMPQAGGSQMPQFFEADGTKSNPFVNPS